MDRWEQDEHCRLGNFLLVHWAEWAGINVTQFKLIREWLDRINARPAIQSGLDVPEPFEMKRKI